MTTTAQTMLEDARRALGAATHERREEGDVRVMCEDDWRTVRDAVAAVLAELDEQ